LTKHPFKMKGFFIACPLLKKPAHLSKHPTTKDSSLTTLTANRSRHRFWHTRYMKSTITDYRPQPLLTHKRQEETGHLFLNQKSNTMLTVMLMLAGLICFWLFFKAIDYCEKI